MSKFLIINGILCDADSHDRVSDDIWAAWKDDRIAARIANDDAHARLAGVDRRIGGGVTWNRSAR